MATYKYISTYKSANNRYILKLIVQFPLLPKRRNCQCGQKYLDLPDVPKLRNFSSWKNSKISHNFVYRYRGKILHK